MRLVFAGTPVFASTALAALHAAGHEIALVLTQPDRPAGRGMQVHASVVKVFAAHHGIDLSQPRSLRLDGRFSADAAQARARIAKAQAQAMVVAAYGLILPQWVLDFMRAPGPAGQAALGCLNVHASLLPRWRGAAPIHRAIEAGDSETGITIMQMDAGLDTGDVLLSQALTICHAAPDADTTGSLHDRLAALGAQMIVEVLEQSARGPITPRPQSHAGITYARKVEKSEAEVDWALDATTIERRIRAFNPAPGAWSMLAGAAVKLWRAEQQRAMSDLHGEASGTILRADQDGLVVACGTGMLRLCELQKAGAKRLDAAAFLRGAAVSAGMRFGLPAPGGG